MIKKISKVNNIANFTSFKQSKDFYHCGSGQNCNVILGFNGSGKTTLSNVISFFADSSFISEDEKKTIYDDLKNGPDSLVELSLQGGSTVKYPANKKHSKDIYIFNTNFVTTHVFDGTKGKMKKFSNVGGEIKNKEIEKITEKLENLHSEDEKLQRENKGIDISYENIKKSKSTSFGKTLTDKNKRLQTQDILNADIPTETIETLESRLETLAAEYELSKKQPELNSDLTELRQMEFSTVNLDLKKVDTLLSQSVQQLSKETLEKKIEEIQGLFADEQHRQSVERWLKFGKDVLENTNAKGGKLCPVCNTDISNKMTSILEGYQGYFDEKYDIFINELAQTAKEIFEIIQTLDDYEKNTAILDKTLIKYEKLLGDCSIKKYDYTSVKLGFKDLEKTFKLKIDNIQKDLIKPNKLDKNITELNSSLLSFQALNINVIKLLEAKKLNTHNIEEQIRKTYNEIILLEVNQTDKRGALDKYKKSHQRIKEITTAEIPELKAELSAELKKIKAESKSITRYLVKMGIDNFDIDINEESPEENIVIKYKGSSSERDRLRNCLSDGEKTALAFAYFLSKFDNEVNTKKEQSESVVIIDDPISSLDDNRLYSTANLVWKSFSDVQQLIVLSHNFLFLKFFNSFFSGKSNCFLLDKGKLVELPEELKNFETPYFYMLKELVRFRQGDLPYQECRKFLPNYSRRVLETFLSFKFAKVCSSKNANYSPGIDDFNVEINETDFSEQVKQELTDKIGEIKHITDKFSHGNLQHTQENFYISQVDLESLVDSTLSVIEKMDKLHETCFTNNNQEAV